MGHGFGIKEEDRRSIGFGGFETVIAMRIVLSGRLRFWLIGCDFDKE